MDPQGLKEFAKEAREFGLSDRFVEIMVEASRQGIQLVRFDSDGDLIDGLQPIEEEERS